MAERWMDVAGYEGLYQVSSIGRVRGLDRTTVTPSGISRRLKGRILRASRDSWGYLRVNLYRGSKRYSACVHVLVCTAFSGPRPDGHEARHLDGKKANCRSSNLEWSTPSQNQKDRVEHGTSNRGERCGNAKLTRKDVARIKQMRTNRIATKEIAGRFGVHVATINRIISGARWGWL